MSRRLAECAVAVGVLVEMTAARLDAVLAIEDAAHAVPWSRGNFVDSLAGRCLAQCLLDECGAMLGYFVAMPGMTEVHLLNLSVAPSAQHRGHARTLLDALVAYCRRAAATQLWLEVREGNARARRLYQRYGFIEVGRRRNYYPAAPGGRREDAIAMSLHLGGTEP